MEEIYKDLSSSKNTEFEKLLNSEFSRSTIEEGKIAEGIVTKITNKLVFIELPGAKSEGTLDVNEIKLLKEEEKLKIGSKISVLIIKLEDKKGDLIVSREKAKKMKSWQQLEKAYEEKNHLKIGKPFCMLPKNKLTLIDAPSYQTKFFCPLFISNVIKFTHSAGFPLSV